MGKNKKKSKSDKPQLDLAAMAQPIDLAAKATDRFSPEDLEMPDYSEDYSDIEFKKEYIWSLDHTLALFLDKTLTAFMRFDYSAPPEGIKRARDAFRGYARKDQLEGFPYERFDTPERKELTWALKWLRKNFTALWT